MIKHSENCKVPICVKDSNPNYKSEVIWYAGEDICKVRPYNKFQKKQIEINKKLKKGLLKNPDIAYTVEDLE